MGEITSHQLDISQRNLPHWQKGGSWYFVTFRANGHTLPENARDEVVTSILHDKGLKFELALAVVMPDHVHLLINPKIKKSGTYFPLAEIIKPLKGASARRINALSGTSGSVWQEEWFDRLIRNEEEWREKYHYILNNAVKAGLAQKPEDYRWLVKGDNTTQRY